MGIYVFEATELDKKFLSEHLSGDDLHFISDPLSTLEQIAAFAEDVEVLSVFVHSHVSASIIESLPNLKLIATRSTGFDHINVPVCESKGIVVSNVPTYGENTVAEHCFALILALSRNVHKAYIRTTAGDFSLDGLRGFDLKGKTIGIVGTGHIGLHAIRIAKGFGMNVLAYDLAPSRMAAEVLGYEYTTLDDLLGRSDIISLHAPLTKDTYHLIGEATVDKIKRGALLINTARGGLVDTQTLLRALDEGILGGAGLDVIEGENVFSEEKQLLRNPQANLDQLRQAVLNNALLRRSDLVITPHMAFDSKEAVERILTTTEENIVSFRAGEPKNKVHT